MPLHELTDLTDIAAVGQGGSGSRFMTSGDGVRVIVKSTIFGGQPHRYLPFNEALGALVGGRIGAPVPQPYVARLTIEQARTFKADADENARLAFAAARVDGIEPLSAEAARGSDPEATASILVLD
jgi:hypothetical protein